MLQLVCDPIEPELPFDPGEGVTLVEARENNCRYPLNDPRSEDFRFCGQDKAFGSSYCGHHYRLCHGDGTRSERLASKLPRGEALAAYADRQNAA